MNFSIKHYLYMMTTVVFLSGCLDTGDTDFEKQVKFEEKLITDHLESNNITATRDNSGMYYQVLEKNTGGTPVEEEDVVSIRYVMKTLGGKFIDSLSMSTEADSAVIFQHVTGAIYPEGINWGVRLMNEGEKFRFYIPSYYGFKNYSYKTLIPSESILVVDVEVVDVLSASDMAAREDQGIKDYIAENELENVKKQSSGVYYQVLEEGSGSVLKAGQSVEVQYKGYFPNGEVFDESKSDTPLSFVVGYNNLIAGFDEGIKLMKKGEKGRIFIPSKHAYNQGTQVIPGLIRKDFLEKYQIRNMPPFQTLIFDVEVTKVN
ncbi:FKBP-type peptidyl-prolyl cis-trans isomerase [Porifericola rhodea]|uniref:FKBP-type peptidyl-prolyl cis-trans isomerase n=1 Tax=Porifericola rhodea TaxID=930972 RepID=UPI0026661B55|nr:FKBP-type peptidyl-prolyl cis-trans isomerase [Porifericola rhodea]WKN31891.1 FKBP-type peptidyl-prolyl cis-trans isomerase [Porifericola rhodea]